MHRNNPATTTDRGGRKWKCVMVAKNEVSGVAALSICESLLLCLSDHNILKEKDVIDILRDVATAHDDAATSAADPTLHNEVAALITAIIDGGNSVRRR